MPSNSDARRNKREKKKNRRGQTSPSPPQQVTEESVESFLSRSATDSGFQGEDDEVTWESAAEEVALDNSLSSFRRETVKEAKKRARKEAREKELNEESDISDGGDDQQMKALASRKTSLSPTQFLESRALGPLTGTGSMQRRAMESLSSRAAPIQVSGAKGMESVIVEAIAFEVASGVNKTQQDNRGIPTRIPFCLLSLPHFQHVSNRACASASSQSCSRIDSCWVWKIPSYSPSETLSGAWHCYPHEYPHCYKEE
jgi:hypothetical protein